jgi:hypothetical protein
MNVLRWTITFDLHISGNEKQKFFVDTYQTNFEFVFPMQINQVPFTEYVVHTD